MSKIYSNVGYCPCGEEVWIEYLPSGNKWFHRFFELNQREIAECPGCGSALKEEDLESK